jgi:hypothetical protein
MWTVPPAVVVPQGVVEQVGHEPVEQDRIAADDDRDGADGDGDVVGRRGYTVVLLANQDRVLLPALRRTQEILTGLRPPGGR